jgi:hypothetical protein
VCDGDDRAAHQCRGLYVAARVVLTCESDDGIVVREVGLCGFSKWSQE